MKERISSKLMLPRGTEVRITEAGVAAIRFPMEIPFINRRLISPLMQSDLHVYPDGSVHAAGIEPVEWEDHRIAIANEARKLVQEANPRFFQCGKVDSEGRLIVWITFMLETSAMKCRMVICNPDQWAIALARNGHNLERLVALKQDEYGRGSSITAFGDGPTFRLEPNLGKWAKEREMRLETC